MSKRVYLASDIFIEIPDDPENVIMQIPHEICEEVGFKEGDTIVIEEIGDGNILLRKEVPKIYESPDKGKTVYSRNFGSKERTLVESLKESNEK